MLSGLDKLTKVIDVIPELNCPQCILQSSNCACVDDHPTTKENRFEAKIIPLDYKTQYKAGESTNLIDFVRAINGDHQEVELAPVKRKRGRKVKTETVLFMRFTNSKGTMPKKEYIRIKILRGLRKVIRKYTSSDTTLNGINRVRDHTDADPKFATNRWGDLVNFYSENISVIDDHFTSIDFNSRNKEGNFNNEYCKRVLDNPVVRILYQFYIEFLFEDINPDLMCNKFNIKCCRLCHASECIEKWQELKAYLKIDMLVELGMEEELVGPKFERRTKVEDTTLMREYESLAGQIQTAGY